MLTHNHLTAIKNKKGAASPQRQETVVCPNCFHHFKFSFSAEITDPNAPTINNYYSQKGKERQGSLIAYNAQQEEPSRPPIPLQRQDNLIDSLKNATLTGLEKLKRLNDLNSLKKSRYSHIDQNQLQELRINEMYESQYYSIFGHSPKNKQLQSALFESRPKLMSPSQKNKGKGRNKSQSFSSVRKKVSNQRWVRQIIVNHELKMLFLKLVEWLQSSCKMTALPSHLKMLLSDYLSSGQQ